MKYSLLQSTFYTYHGYILIDCKKCQVGWVIDYIRPIINRCEAIDCLLN